MTYNDTLHNDIMTFTNTKQIYTFNSIHNAKLY